MDAALLQSKNCLYFFFVTIYAFSIHAVRKSQMAMRCHQAKKYSRPFDRHLKKLIKEINCFSNT
jgi:hypothetical protein